MSGRGRSSFRGSSYRGSSSYRGGGGSGYRGVNSYSDRGGYSTSSSRGGRYGSTNSYSTSGFQEARSRYPSNSDKYNSRGRDDSYNRRSSYRPEDSYTSTRDHSRGSPDRKRMRTDQGSSGRRTNDVGYHTGGDGYGNQRYENTSYMERRYSSERHGRSPKEFRTSRIEGSLYSKGADSSAMSRPRTRGSFRGRLSSRGIRGRRIIRRNPYARSKNLSVTLSTRRVLSRSVDTARRLKIQKMRSSVRKRASSPNQSEKEWENEADEEKKKKKSDDKEGTPASSKKKSPKKEKPEKKEETENEKENENETADDKNKETETGDEEPADGSGKDDDDADADKSSKDLPKSRYTGRSFIKLTCIHCSTKCVTFKEYSLHFRRSRHQVAMRRLGLQYNAQLSKMRTLQRNKQRELDEKSKDPYLRTQFCMVCKLNYRQPKANHQASEAHREIKKFLTPYCRTCRLTFNNPMLYESHLCSLEHIKRKARIDYLRSKTKSDEGSDEGVKELDLDNFMTLDSVGDVDDDEEEEEEEKAEADGEKKDSSEAEKSPKKKKKTEINVGSEHVRKIEVYYCELCKMYLPRHEEPEAALKKHCRIRTHLQRYVRHRDDKELRKQAEKMHRKNQEAKEAKKKSDESGEVTASTPKKGKESNGVQDSAKKESASKKKIENGSVGDEDENVDKLWEDVDKDLGDILREVEPTKSSDDEDDSRTTNVRYDRFRYTDKKAGDAEKSLKLDESELLEEEEEEEEEGEITAHENSVEIKAEEK
uniref:Uncharacterized protein n=1 Tax=Xenopsylla cheopis TaxID=163159 RepID=A0A6M2DTG6_XENCH